MFFKRYAVLVFAGIAMIALSLSTGCSSQSAFTPQFSMTPISTPNLKSSSTSDSEFTTQPSPTTIDQRRIPVGTPAGSGVLTSQVGDPIEYLTGNFQPLGYAWYEPLGEKEFILVYAGEDAYDSEQGVVIVLRSGTIWHPIGSRHETKTQSGGLLIVDARGERLILRSVSGTIFYFDIPAGQFVDSLTDTVPTMTPGPTVTLIPTGNLVTDDASDEPGLAVVDLPLDTDLPFFINPLGDEDWHSFKLEEDCDLQISLRNLFVPYAIELYKPETDEMIAGEIATSTRNKIIQFPAATDGHYLIRVWGLSGAWDSINPYILKINCKYD